MPQDILEFVNSLPPEKREIFIRKVIADNDFIEFMKLTKIRSDDPLNPLVTDWKPWDYLIDQGRSWAAGESQIVLKDRQLGYSWLVAGYSVWLARRGRMVALISKGQVESRELLAKCAFIEKNLPPFMKMSPTIRVDDMTYKAGKIIAFPSTPDAGVSFTFQLVVFDEAHFHPYAAMNYAAIRPTISAGGQFIALSTADPAMGGYGWFPDMYWASKKGESGYTSRFIPWNARPGRDQAWLAKERAAYTGMPENFDAYYADSDAQAFAGKTGLVFPMFNPEVHVTPARIPIEQCRRVVAGLDLGGGDPTTIAILGLDSAHRVHVYDQFYARGAQTLDDLAAFLVRFPLDAIECPPEQATVIETLKSTYLLPAHAANNKRSDGLNLFAAQLNNQTLTYDPKCKDLIAEFPGYRWSERTDPNDKTRYMTKTPVDHHADGIDAVRYALMEILAFMHTPGQKLPTTSYNSGRPLTKKAV